MTSPVLAATGVSMQFGGLRALNDVSFALAEGEIIGLIGRPAAREGRICSSALSKVVHATQAIRTEKQSTLSSNSVNLRSARCWDS